jgi:hypothetical protein
MFPHIKLAIAQYQGALSGKDREAIGEMVRVHIHTYWLTNTYPVSDGRNFGKRPQLHQGFPCQWL